MPSPTPDAALTSAVGTALTFKLPSRRSSALLADCGLADLYKIFGVRATMAPCKHADVVEVTLTGSNHYAELARRWAIARVAPECVMNLPFSCAQLQALFGAKQHKLVELQHQSCCYVAEHPRGSGNLLLQGSTVDTADAVQWISRIASTKRLNIELHLGGGFYRGSAAPHRQLTPFQSHAIQLRPFLAAASSPDALSSWSDATRDDFIAAPCSPASFVPTSPALCSATTGSKSPTLHTRLSMRVDLPSSKSQSSSSPPLPLLKPSPDKKSPAPVIIDGESVALTHGKRYFFSTRGLQLVHDWSAIAHPLFQLALFHILDHSRCICMRKVRPFAPQVRQARTRLRHRLPERLDAHPNNQRPPLIDSEVLQSLNTSGALVADADPVSRIFDLAKRCSLRHRSAVIISRKSVFNRPCESPSHFHVLSFHISGSSFAILPKLPTAATGTAFTVDSILMPSQHNTPSSVFAISPIVVSSKHKPATPLLTPKYGSSSAKQDKYSEASSPCCAADVVRQGCLGPGL